MDEATVFEAAAAYAKQREWLSGATAIVYIGRGDFRLYTDTTTEVTWWLHPNAFLSGDLSSVYPTATADASHLKGTVIRFMGVDQFGTLVVGDPTLGAQKIMRKATVTGQVTGLATNGGAGLVGVSQTSSRDVDDGSCIGARTVVICDNTNINRAGWANYIEAYKLPDVEATCLGQEITLFNDSGNTVRRNPYQQPGHGADIMVATWYSSGGYYGDDGSGSFKEVDGTCTAAIGMIGKEGGSWDRGIVIFDGALGESNEALSMAGNMRLAWYDTDSNDENSALSAFVIGSRPSGSSGSLRAAIYNNSTGGNTVYDFNPVEFKALEDNAVSVGSSVYRFSQFYAAASNINTSDEREKQQISDLSEAELAVGASLKIRKYKWNAAVEEKGDAARWHFGFIAQEVIAAFEAQGLDAFEYGAVCYDTWEAEEAKYDSQGNLIEPAREAGDRYGVRYDECYALMMAAKFA